MIKKIIILMVMTGVVFVSGSFAEAKHYEPTFSVRKHASTLIKEKIAESGVELAEMTGSMFSALKTFVDESGFGEDIIKATENIGKDLNNAYESAAEKMNQVYEEELKKDVEVFIGGLKSGFDAFSDSLKKSEKK